ncbi:MAG: UDP-2,3-diacylglucosamine hydrolase [Crocinitomicaceae bacterium]|jgi:UDP-2,3-diacylglucosamine hydrolase
MTNNSKKIYFASDFHLGAPDYESSLVREKKIVSWLNHIEKDAAEIFLVGDIFDFWFEYKRAIPRGFARLQGKIADLTDKGIPVHVFTGNHDMWIFDYLPKELGVKLYREPIEREFFGKKYFIGHGDGLGPGDKGYKFLKKVFANKFCQWCFARLHPNFGIWLADRSSKTSRAKSGDTDEKYHGDENEWLFQFCLDTLKTTHYDNFIFGHRHLPIEKKVGENSTYYNLGEWINYCTYMVVDEDSISLETWK